MANYFCELVIANTDNNGVSVKNSLNFKILSFAIHIYLHEPKPSLIIHKLIIHREDFSIFPNQYFEVSCDLKLVGPLQTNTSQ